MFQRSPVGMAMTDAAGRITAWNEAAVGVLGLSREGALGQPLPAPVPEQAARWAEVLARAAAGEVLNLLEFQFRTPSGRVRDVALSLLPIEGAGLGVIAQDVTERNAPARRAAEAQHRLEVVLEAIPAPIFFKDAAGVYLGCNRAFEAYLGRPRARIVGLGVHEVAPPELAEIYRHADDALLAAGGTQVYETQVRWADGALREVVFSKATFLGEDGKVAGLVGSILDITERKRAEQALRASEQKFRAAFDQAKVGLVLLGRGARFVEMNPAFREMLGRSDEALRRLRLADVLHPDDLAAGMASYESLVAGERDHASSLRRVLREDGALRYVRIGASAIRDAEGAFEAVVAVIEDVTEKELATQALRESEARASLAGRLASLGTLAAGVAHEINNPLAYVVANLDFVRGALTAAEGSEVRQALEDAAEGAARVSRIVQDLKGFARVDDAVARVDLVRVLRSAANLARAEVKRRARLEVDLPPLPRVAGSTARLGQVFLNLLVNAAQAIPEGDPEAHEVRLRAWASAKQVMVEVSDTGTGIDPAIRHRIFDPFFTTKPVGIGTGLGLAISHQIVTAAGGTIEVESAPGRGATFRVTLPASAENDAVSAA
ncbi:PAS domain S-box protein [Anaeromyxobacter paludicola]|uniref:histidine kinase n=1 Tax=Anaeromyxobacter paludicola TaxID=2918171 RepID=A0ABM7X5K4_9BACT|nr:PAS domain S-box protein [Anaeromyxobacter paludicola]BDG07098.1 hypothetical protein AMPC_02110 [Anaeromyxobacter paludicola]